MKEQQGKKNFFQTKIFKWILILVLECISMIIFAKVIPSSPESNVFFTKPFLIYLGVCIVLSIGALMKLNKFQRKMQHEEHKGVIRIMTTQQHQDEQIGRFSSRLAVLIIVSFVFSPFIAPVTVGTMIHNIICKAF